MMIQYLADGPAMPRTMDNRYAFTPIPGLGGARMPCRTCGKGDVNVNVNVNTGSNASVGSSRQSSEESSNSRGGGGYDSGHRNEGQARTAVQPQGQNAADVRRVIREELARQARPQFESPARERRVEYRPIVIPRDRIVERVQYRPFNVVWDRLRNVFTNRDVMHPVDRVRKVPAILSRPSFEGARR